MFPPAWAAYLGCFRHLWECPPVHRLSLGISVYFKVYIKAELPTFEAECRGELTNSSSEQETFTLPLTTTASARWLINTYLKLRFIDLLVEFHIDSPSKIVEINTWGHCLPFGHFLTATRTPADRDYFALWPEPEAGKVLHCHNNPDCSFPNFIYYQFMDLTRTFGQAYWSRIFVQVQYFSVYLRCHTHLMCMPM